MKDEFCPCCGQKVEPKWDDVTEECKLEWNTHCDKSLVHITHQGNPVIHLGIESHFHQPLDPDYYIEKVYETHNSGWWFKILKRR